MKNRAGAALARESDCDHRITKLEQHLARLQEFAEMLRQEHNRLAELVDDLATELDQLGEPSGSGRIRL